MHAFATIGRLALLAMLVLPVPSSRGDDWPNYRGPHHDGVSAEAGWSAQWPASGPAVLWKANVGVGFSSFAVAGQRVYTAGNASNTDTVYCLDVDTGKVLWKHAYASDLGDRFFEGGPTSTPTVEGDRVYWLGRGGDLFSLDAASGKVVWSKNVHDETHVRVPGWGFAGSPLVAGELLVLNAGAGGVAVEKGTGNVVWKSATSEAGYSTPVPMSAGGKSLVVLSNAREFLAVDVRTGEEAWRIRWVTQYGANAADPLVNGNRILVSSGYSKGAALLQSAPLEPKTLWKSKVLSAHLSSAVRVGEFVYGADGNSGEAQALKCFEFVTGKERWSQPDIDGGSLIAADGKLIVLSEKGELTVAPAVPDGFKVIARAKVLRGKCWTAPVLSGGRLFCRNAAGEVVCLDLRGK